MINDTLQASDEQLSKLEQQLNNFPKLPSEEWVSARVSEMFEEFIVDAVDGMFSDTIDQFEELKGELETTLGSAASLVTDDIDFQSPLDAMDRVGMVIDSAREDLEEICDDSSTYSDEMLNKADDLLDSCQNQVIQVAEKGIAAVTTTTVEIQRFSQLDSNLTDKMKDQLFPKVLGDMQEKVITPLNDTLSFVKETHKAIDSFNSDGTQKLNDVITQVDDLTSKLKDIVDILVKIEPFLG